MHAEHAEHAEHMMTHKVRIKNIHKWAYEEELAKAFSDLGLTPTKVKIETYGPKSLEKGWAEFSNAEDAQKALELNGKPLRDQPLQVSPFQNEPASGEKKEQKANPEKNTKKPNKPKGPKSKAAASTAQTTTNDLTNPTNATNNNTNNTPSTSTPSAQPGNVPSTQQARPANVRAKKGAKGDAPVYLEEFERLKAKYKSFNIESQEPLTITLLLPPSDPDFPFELKGLLLQISIPATYPAVPCVLKVTNPDSEVSDKLKKKIEAAVLKRAQTAYSGKPMLAGLLFWLDRNLEQLLVDKQMTEDFNLAKMGIQLVVNATFKPPPRPIDTNPDQPPLLISTSPPPSQTSISTAQTTDETTEESSTTHQEEKPAAPTPTITTALKGTRIKFEEMSLLNVGILECVLLNITVSCEKCRNRFDVVNLIKGAQTSDLCEKCKHPYSVGIRPEIMHEYSNIMGYLDLEGCAIFDILPSSFKVACFECNGSLMFKDQQYSETKTEQNCYQCHQKTAIALSRPSFTKMKAKKAVVPIDPAILEEKKKKKKRDPNDLLIKPGQPLPSQGTCKHYKHSFRWLRFPCCGKAFPCDICHEIGTNGEHEPKWANRMICGFCCREQSWSQKPCVACGGDVTGSIHSKFWEGGAGQRDKSKMSNKDSHKFKNSDLKTQSKKHTRVGPKKE